MPIDDQSIRDELDGLFIVVRSGDGNIVFLATDDEHVFFVSVFPEPVVCTCPEFVRNSTHGRATCTHIRAVGARIGRPQPPGSPQ